MRDASQQQLWNLWVVASETAKSSAGSLTTEAVVDENQRLEGCQLAQCRRNRTCTEEDVDGRAKYREIDESV